MRCMMILMYYTFQHGPYMLIASQVLLVLLIKLDRGKHLLSFNVDFHNLFILKRSTIDLFESR